MSKQRSCLERNLRDGTGMPRAFPVPQCDAAVLPRALRLAFVGILTLARPMVRQWVPSIHPGSFKSFDAQAPLLPEILI